MHAILFNVLICSFLNERFRELFISSLSHLLYSRLGSVLFLFL